MIQEIINFVTERGGGVSFAELSDYLGERGSGDYQYEILPNVVLWSGMSLEFAEACMSDRMKDALEITPTTILVYLADGMALTLPIAKSPPQNGYAKPHWAPVTLSPRKTPRGPFRQRAKS